MQIYKIITLILISYNTSSQEIINRRIYNQSENELKISINLYREKKWINGYNLILQKKDYLELPMINDESCFFLVNISKQKSESSTSTNNAKILASLVLSYKIIQRGNRIRLLDDQQTTHPYLYAHSIHYNKEDLEKSVTIKIHK
jgi:hypothetical protein